MKFNVLFSELLPKKMPEGAVQFISSHEKLFGTKPRVVLAKSEGRIARFIESLDGDSVVLMPMYWNPFALGGVLVGKIRALGRGVKIYACGPLAAQYPQDIIDHFGLDGVVLNNSFPLAFHGQGGTPAPAPTAYDVDGKKMNVVLDTSFTCKNNCSFCKIPGVFHVKSDVGATLEGIRRNESLRGKKFQFVRITCNNILADHKLGEIKLLMDSLHEMFEYEQVDVWACSSDFVRLKDEVPALSSDRYIVNWQIGFESFSESQLRRFNKNTLRQNIECVDWFLRSRERFQLCPLFLLFDPWVTRRELVENAGWFKRVRAAKTKCIQGRFQHVCPSRHWIPFKGTRMFEEARRQGLLRLDKMSPIQTLTDLRFWGSSDLYWSFVDPEAREIFDFACEIQQFFNRKIKSLRNPPDGLACWKCDGRKSKTNKEYARIEGMFESWMASMDPSLKPAIRRELAALRKHLATLFRQHRTESSIRS